MTDVFSRCAQFTIAREAMEAGIYPYFLAFDDQEAAVAHLDSREIVMFGSNNYLGLTRDRRVVAASRDALDRYGTSCTGSRLLNGNLRLHEELESELAEFFGKEAALVFATGYQANLGAVAALAGAGDVILADREAHASLLDGSRLSRADLKLFRHNDVEDLRRRLRLLPASRGRLVVVDGVYSMGGDVCPLPDIVQACQEFGARLLVDDAHGAGLLDDGKGTCSRFGLTDDVDLVTITFSKAFASLGGAVMGDADVIHYLRHQARSEIFSAGMTAPSAAAALEVLRILRAEPWRSRLPLQHAVHTAARLRAAGFATSPTESAILTVLMTDPLSTAFAWKRLMDLGIYVNAVVPPAASPRLRTSYTAAHLPEHLDRMLAAFATLHEEGLVALAEPA
jgi:8-amino-7-oxononanoate synthase